jgi:hypothetical protein
MSAGPEHRLQIAIKKWTREAVPFPHVFLAFDRSAARSRLQHLHEKTRGARAGTPDVVLLWRGAAIWCELKAPDGVLSIHQTELHAEMALTGHHVSVVRSVRAYAEELAARQVPLGPLAMERADAADRTLSGPGQRLGRKAPAKPRPPKITVARLRKLEAVRGRTLF